MFFVRKWVGVEGVVMLFVAPSWGEFPSRVLSLTNIYRPLTAFRLRFCLDSLALFECCLSPVPSLFMVVNILKTGTVARPGFGGDCEALGEGPVVDSEEGLLLSSKASPATGGRRWKDGSASSEL